MSAPHQSGSGSMGAILAEVLTGATRLVRGEIALARAEVSQKLRSAASALVQFGIAVVLGITAVNLLAGAGVAALVAMGWSTIAASLVMGLGLLILCYTFVRLALYRLSAAHLKQSRSLSNFGRDAAALKSMVKSDDQQ